MELGTVLGTVLGIWAHPDDEAYLSGGLMAGAAGSRVVCVTATRGELGTADLVFEVRLRNRKRHRQTRRDTSEKRLACR